MPFDSSSSSSFSAGELKPELDTAAGSVKGGPVDDLENAGHGAHTPHAPGSDGGDATQSTQSAPIKSFTPGDLDHAGSGAGGPKGETADLERAGSGADKSLLHGGDHHDIAHDDHLGAKADTHFGFDHHDDPLHSHLDSSGAGDHLDLSHGDGHDPLKDLTHDHVKGIDHDVDHHTEQHGAHTSSHHDLFDDGGHH